MTDRIDEYLEGNLDREALTEGEGSEADAAALAINETRAYLAVPAIPDVTAPVMQRIHSLAKDQPQQLRMFDRVLRSLWTPHAVSIRPVYALAGAGFVAVLFLMAPNIFDIQPVVPQLTAGRVDEHLFVQFRLQTEASTVQLAGSFSNWEPKYDLQQVAPGVWTITVPLTAGVHDYAFVVDGQHWIPDPYAPGINDGFGGTNSRLTLLAPDTPRL